jgi:hypothetical protein
MGHSVPNLYANYADHATAYAFWVGSQVGEDVPCLFHKALRLLPMFSHKVAAAVTLVVRERLYVKRPWPFPSLLSTHSSCAACP